MATESTPAKVRLNDLLGHADEAQPLLERLEEGGCSPYCDSLEREAAAEIQSLQESYGQLLAESVRLRAAVHLACNTLAPGGLYAGLRSELVAALRPNVANNRPAAFGGSG